MVPEVAAAVVEEVGPRPLLEQPAAPPVVLVGLAVAVEAVVVVVVVVVVAVVAA